MIADLKPYPAMKGSGVEWLGEVPEHWDVRRGKNIFRCIDVRSETGDEELLTVSSERGVVPRRSADVTMFKAESYVGHKLCWPGDLVINSLWAWARGLGVSKYHGIISTAYGVYRLKGAVDPSFIHALVRSTPFHWELRVRSKGVWTSRLQLTDDSFLCAPFPIPPLPEQTAIVRFLDYVDRRIQRYVRAKQKLIGLLEALKATIIHRAVTRGLDPDVPLKPSGVEWLGDVPDNWDVPLLGSALRCIEQGWSPVAAEGIVESEQWAVITLSAVKNGYFNKEAIKPIEKSASVASNIELQPGDFLLSRSNTRSLVGDVAVVERVRPRTILCDLVYRLRFKAGVLVPRYLMYVLLSPIGRRQIEGDARGSSQTMVKLSHRHIRGWRIPLPQTDEQLKIVGSLDGVSKRVRAAVTGIEREIDLLHEYRTRLIADVVTGKLDVREAAANLPDEAGSPHESEAAEEFPAEEITREFAQ